MNYNGSYLVKTIVLIIKRVLYRNLEQSHQETHQAPFVKTSTIMENVGLLVNQSQSLRGGYSCFQANQQQRCLQMMWDMASS